MKNVFLVALCLACSLSATAQSLSGLCMLSASRHNDEVPGWQVVLASSSCDKAGENCNTNNSTMPANRWTGISAESLEKDGTNLTATLHGDAGDLTCSGLVHDHALSGRYDFVPSQTFLSQMQTLGFDGITPQKQLSFLMLDVSATWVKQMKDLGVLDLTTNKLISLRALRVDADYIRAMANAGYPELHAGRLIEMKAVGVTPERAREAKDLGFAPTEHELVQMSIFHIDRAFVERMRARGLNDLTLDKLIKIKIFKVDE